MLSVAADSGWCIFTYLSDILNNKSREKGSREKEGGVGVMMIWFCDTLLSRPWESRKQFDDVNHCLTNTHTHIAGHNFPSPPPPPHKQILSDVLLFFIAYIFITLI